MIEARSKWYISLRHSHRWDRRNQCGPARAPRHTPALHHPPMSSVSGLCTNADALVEYYRQHSTSASVNTVRNWPSSCQEYHLRVQHEKPTRYTSVEPATAQPDASTPCIDSATLCLSCQMRKIRCGGTKPYACPPCVEKNLFCVCPSSD